MALHLDVLKLLLLLVRLRALHEHVLLYPLAHVVHRRLLVVLGLAGDLEGLPHGLHLVHPRVLVAPRHVVGAALLLHLLQLDCQVLHAGLLFYRLFAQHVVPVAELGVAILSLGVVGALALVAHAPVVHLQLERHLAARAAPAGARSP